MGKSLEKLARGRKKKKSVSFNPNQEFIEDAVQSFIKKGGEIKKLESISEEHEEIMNRFHSNNVWSTYIGPIRNFKIASWFD